MFTVLYQHDGWIELKSQYHYWKIVQIPGTKEWALFHKYRIHQKYHRQYLSCPGTLRNIYSYIKRHDRYISSLI